MAESVVAVTSGTAPGSNPDNSLALACFPFYFLFTLFITEKYMGIAHLPTIDQKCYLGN